jgi:hypothetical protein
MRSDWVAFRSLKKSMADRTRSLIQFLTDELAVSSDSIKIGLQYSEEIDSLLPIVLWQYGFITLTELETIFDWLAASTSVISSSHLSDRVTLWLDEVIQ